MKRIKDIHRLLRMALGALLLECGLGLGVGIGCEATLTEAPECVTAAECGPALGDLECSEKACLEGRCVAIQRTPVQVCQEHYVCWSGACCFTCLSDQGTSPGTVDEQDGPCMTGDSDQACGRGNGLCEDCTSHGMLCDAPFGRCFVPECHGEGECAEAPICKLSECIHGRCVIVDDTSGKECSVGAWMGTCSKGKCSL